MPKVVSTGLTTASVSRLDRSDQPTLIVRPLRIKLQQDDDGLSRRQKTAEAVRIVARNVDPSDHQAMRYK